MAWFDPGELPGLELSGFAGALLSAVAVSDVQRIRRIFTIFEGASEIQRMPLGRTVTGLDVR